MIINIYYHSDVPIYEQIVRQIVIGVANGDLQRGESLPSVRALASDVGVNLHTVNKAYQKLQEMGYLDMDRRVGAKVSNSIGPLDERRKNAIFDELEFLIKDLYNCGFSDSDIENAIRERTGGKNV